MRHPETVRLLGRGLIVEPGADVAAHWAGETRVRIDDAALREPRGIADELHAHWAARRPVVVELAAEVDELRAPETDSRPPYALTPAFEFSRERLYFLARSNNYDARRGRLVWGAALEAQRFGATPGGEGDVVLPDGRAAWCDGGPRANRVALPGGAVLVHRVRLDEGSLVPDAAADSLPAVLAPDQTAAVCHEAGPARIIAPAGSGKTRVLTERFRLLVRWRAWGSASVCAVAYNVRAKDEMQQRLADLTSADRRKVRTLHSLGYDVVRRATGATTVLDEWQVRERVEPLVEVRRRANTDVYAPYLEALGEVRLGLVPPEEVEARRDDVPGFAAMFARYREGLRRDGALDHDEQIYGAVEALLRDPAVRGELRRECRHLLVDEFQDLTPAQLLMLRLVAAPAYDVFGVGDDDQVIYGYAGADPEFLIRYDRSFPGATTHDLCVNYRCPPAVVDGARNLLSHNRRRVPKEIHAAKPAADPIADPALDVRLVPGERVATAAFGVVHDLIGAGVEPASIAVLARVNAALLPVQLLCAQAGVPHWVAVTASVLERSGAHTALAYLRLAVSVADGTAMRGPDVAAALRRPPRSLPPRFLDRVRGRRHWMLPALRAAGEPLDDRSAARFDEFLAQLATLGAAVGGGADTRAVLVALRDEVGLGAALAAFDGSGKRPDGSHADDLAALISVAALEPDPRTFETWLRDHLTDTPHAGATEGVALATVHRVKGMEWPYVVVLGANEGQMPHDLADDVEEERRVFHVAITRCSERVHVVAQQDRPSRFVAEMRAPAPPPPATPGERVEVDGRRVRLDPPARARAERAAAGTPLFEALRAWRSERAKRDRVPAYVVLSDAHLAGIADAAPRTLAQLARCPGIGPTKLERYGDEILAVIERFA